MSKDYIRAIKENEELLRAKKKAIEAKLDQVDANQTKLAQLSEQCEGHMLDLKGQTKDVMSILDPWQNQNIIDAHNTAERAYEMFKCDIDMRYIGLKQELLHAEDDLISAQKNYYKTQAKIEEEIKG